MKSDGYPKHSRSIATTAGSLKWFSFYVLSYLLLMIMDFLDRPNLLFLTEFGLHLNLLTMSIVSS